MADNFNLRTFLTENKLTKNAQLLNELGGQDISTLGWEALEQNTDPEIAKLLADYKTSLSADYDACHASAECRNEMGISPQYFNPSSNKTIAIQKELAKLATEKGVDVKQQAPPAKPAEAAKALGFWDKVKSKVGLKEEEDLDQETTQGTDISGYWVMYGGLNKGVPMLIKIFPSEEQAQQALQDAPTTYGQHVLRGNWGIESAQDWLASGGEIGPDSMGHPDRVPRKPLSPEERAEIRQLDFDARMEREGTQNKKPIMKETNLTAKERRLVEMVQDAMGYTNNDEDQEFDPGQDIEQAQHDIERQYEGSEMSDETVIPEYNTIDELMNSIDHGTNKVAEEHKMQEMKKIAEALRMKAKKMEESEHAAHISPKDLKQLASDAAKLEKAAEKLKSAFDKKFNKKEKAPAAPKAEKVEALQEGTFDLRKFLVENKLTAGSKRLNEYGDSPTYIVDTVEEFLENSGMDPQGQLDAVEELALWCTGKIAQLENEV